MNVNIVYDKRDSVTSTPDTNLVKKAVCAVSGGMDSATCLFHAVKLYGKENVIGVSMYYGQKHDVELTKAKEECERLGVEFIEMDLTPVFSFNKNISALLKGSDKSIAQNKDYATLMHEKVENNEAPISDEYIPNRNSLFLNVLCSIGLQKFNNTHFAVITGIHSDDDLKTEGSNISAYPDCSIEFADATNDALQFATAGLCYIYAPLAAKTKAQVADFGVENGMTKADFNQTWSCYKGVEPGRTKACGKCPTDIDRINALVKSGIYTEVSDITDNYELTVEEASAYFN